MDFAASSNPALHILVIEDVVADFELIEHALQESGLSSSCIRVDGHEELSREFNKRAPDVVLCDHGNTRFDSLSVLEIIRARSKVLPFVIVTGSMNRRQMAEALAQGVDEIVAKHRLAELAPAVRRARRFGEIRQRVADLEQERDRLQAEVEAWRFGRPRRPTMIPICASCRKIRTGGNDWESLDVHFSEHFNIRFTHGLCSACVENYLPGAKS